MAAQWLDHRTAAEYRADVVLGGGAASFAETATATGRTLAQQLPGAWFHRNAAELDAVTRADDRQPSGLFAEGNMPVYNRPQGQLPRQYRQAGNHLPAHADRTAGIPTPGGDDPQVITLLEGNPKGFFLQVEGA